MSATLWTPLDDQRKNLLTDALAHEPARKELEDELRRMDPYLDVVWVSERVAEFPPHERFPGMVPGRFHIRRRNPETLDFYFPIMGPDGEFAPPSLKVAEDMRAADLWRSGALSDLRERQEREARERERAEELLREQKRDNGAEAFRAAKRVSGEGGMTRKVWGKK